MAGIPVALSLGVPAGTFLGKVSGWRVAFLAMTALTVLLLVWITAAVPDFPGQSGGERPRMLHALRVPGVAPVLFVTLVFVLAHTIIYAYIATFLDRVGMGGNTDLVLLVFGAASLASIWIVGAQKVVPDLDTAMRRLEEHTLPLENVRAQAVYGKPSHINRLLIMNAEPVPGRGTVILLREAIGF